MRRLALLLFLVAPSLWAQVQSTLSGGILYGVDPTDGSQQKSIEALLVTKRAGAYGEFQNKNNWTFGTRGYFARPFYISIAIKDNRLDTGPLVIRDHSFILQSAIGIDKTIHGWRGLLQVAEAQRLKTSSQGYVATGSFYIPTKWPWLQGRIVGVFGNKLSDRIQIKGGFDCVVHFRKR